MREIDKKKIKTGRQKKTDGRTDIRLQADRHRVGSSNAGGPTGGKSHPPPYTRNGGR